MVRGQRGMTHHLSNSAEVIGTDGNSIIGETPHACGDLEL